MQSIIDTDNDLQTLSYSDENYQKKNYELTTLYYKYQQDKSTLYEYYTRHGVEFLYYLQECINSDKKNSLYFDELNYALDDLIKIKQVLTILVDR